MAPTELAANIRRLLATCPEAARFAAGSLRKERKPVLVAVARQLGVRVDGTRNTIQERLTAYVLDRGSRDAPRAYEWTD